MVYSFFLFREVLAAFSTPPPPSNCVNAAVCLTVQAQPLLDGMERTLRENDRESHCLVLRL